MKRIDDKFYTKEEVIKQLISLVNLDEYDMIIEPSAGDGRFLKYLPSQKTIALDIAPEGENILQMDFFNFKIDKHYNNILVIGNPPFGKNSSLAVKFFNHASQFANTIAFIVPKTFRKPSIQNRLNLNFHLIIEQELVTDEFDYYGKEIKVPAIIQVWEKRAELRMIIKQDYNNDYFDFVDKDNNPDLAVRRVGFYAGKCFKEWEDKNINTHYFIKVKNIDKDKVYNILNSIEWEHNNTVGSRSISKPELVNEFLNKLKGE